MSEMRLQRALARAGVASRRRAEELIEAGSVTVDGKVATLGSKVDPDRQRISVRGRKIQMLPNRWILLHKPLGVVTTADDEQGRRTVLELIPNNKGLTYVGRLDVMTTGVLLLTTDGEAVHRLTHPNPPALFGVGARGGHRGPGGGRQEKRGRRWPPGRPLVGPGQRGPGRPEFG